MSVTDTLYTDVVVIKATHYCGKHTSFLLYLHIGKYGIKSYGVLSNYIEACVICTVTYMAFYVSFVYIFHCQIMFIAPVLFCTYLCR